MNTIIIYDQLGEEPIKFLVLKGDYSKFNLLYVNSTDSDEALVDEFLGMLYDDSGELVAGLDWRDEFPVSATYADSKVIVAGFIP
jgi:hypothetical protein